MGQFKNLAILRQESQYRLGENAEPVFSEPITHTKEDLIQTFKAMKQVLLDVNNMKMPHEELLQSSGVLKQYSHSKAQNNSEKQLAELLSKQKQSKEYFEALQAKRKLKSQDMPFIKSIYYEAERSDLYLESKVSEFNNNRKRYPYLDMVLPKRAITEQELYAFAMGTLTRGFSEQRKNEKLAFQNAKAVLKRVSEQVALLKGRQPPSVKNFETELQNKLNQFYLLRQNCIDIAEALGSQYSAEQLFERYVARNEQTLPIDAKQAWDIATEQDLYRTAKQSALPNKTETKQASNAVGASPSKPVPQEAAPITPEHSTDISKPEKLTQLAFVLEGENIGKIVAKPHKKTPTHEK